MKIKDLLTRLSQRAKFVFRNNTIIFILGIMAFLLFIFLTQLMQRGYTKNFDEQILISLRNFNFLFKSNTPRWITEIMRDITALGGGIVIFTATFLFLIFLWRKKLIRTLTLISVSIVGGFLLNIFLKEFYVRSRPYVIPPFTHLNTFSFPSGHTMMSFVTYLTMAIVLANIYKKKRLKFLIFTLALSLTFAIGISRLYLGVHYPTDIWGGWLMGLVWVLFIRIISIYWNDDKI